MIFPDVQLGDPVLGFLSYDLSTPPDDPEAELPLYIHGEDFKMAAMLIENPRDGSDIEIGGAFDPLFGLFAAAGVSNDLEDDAIGVYDAVDAIQFAEPPIGFAGFLPIVHVSFLGPADVLDSNALPAELNLDDWPEAVIGFSDLLDLGAGPDAVSSYVLAEIDSLTPVLVPEPGSALLAALALAAGWMKIKTRRPSLSTNGVGEIAQNCDVNLKTRVGSS
jgi:hypothetical protein